MTKRQALKALEGPLQFGNQAQIEAREWLSLAEHLKDWEVEIECPECHGSGIVDGDFDPNQRWTLQQLRELAQKMKEELGDSQLEVSA